MALPLLEPQSPTKIASFCSMEDSSTNTTLTLSCSNWGRRLIPQETTTTSRLHLFPTIISIVSCEIDTCHYSLGHNSANKDIGRFHIAGISCSKSITSESVKLSANKITFFCWMEDSSTNTTLTLSCSNWGRRLIPRETMTTSQLHLSPTIISIVSCEIDTCHYSLDHKSANKEIGFNNWI